MNGGGGGTRAGAHLRYLVQNARHVSYNCWKKLRGIIGGRKSADALEAIELKKTRRGRGLLASGCAWQGMILV